MVGTLRKSIQCPFFLFHFQSTRGSRDVKMRILRARDRRRLRWKSERRRTKELPCGPFHARAMAPRWVSDKLAYKTSPRFLTSRHPLFRWFRVIIERTGNKLALSSSRKPLKLVQNRSLSYTNLLVLYPACGTQHKCGTQASTA